MNDKEIRQHKVRRKAKKKRREKRKKEEAKRARIGDRRRRLEVQVEEAIEKCINSGELQRVNADPADGRLASESVKRNRIATKRSANTDHEEVPKKAARLHGLKEISATHVTLTKTCLGSGSYGSCYLGTFRGMTVVVKSTKGKESLVMRQKTE